MPEVAESIYQWLSGAYGLSRRRWTATPCRWAAAIERAALWTMAAAHRAQSLEVVYDNKGVDSQTSDANPATTRSGRPAPSNADVGASQVKQLRFTVASATSLVALPAMGHAGQAFDT